MELNPLNTANQTFELGGSPYHRKIVQLQLLTIFWMSLEAAIAVFAATQAHSVALLGFGADSGIELMSALVVFVRFQKASRIKERTAARISGLLLFALAAFILFNSILALTNPRFRPAPSYLGIALLIAAAIFMPWLAAQKKQLAKTSHSDSLRADAVQSSMCAYLAWIALGGLVLNAIFNFALADPAAALLLIPIIIHEGLEAMRGRSCGDSCC